MNKKNLVYLIENYLDKKKIKYRERMDGELAMIDIEISNFGIEISVCSNCISGIKLIQTNYIYIMSEKNIYSKKIKQIIKDLTNINRKLNKNRNNKIKLQTFFYARENEDNYYIANVRMKCYTPISVFRFCWLANICYDSHDFINNGYTLDPKSGVFQAYTSTPNMVNGFHAAIAYMEK